MLEFKSVGFSYHGRDVLRSVTFSLAKGTATALVGPNGAGKTTLLRLASGVLRPVTGTILLDGRPLMQLSIRDAARVVAVVPQHLDIPFEFTVEQVVEQGRTPHVSLFGRFSREDRLAIHRALDLANASALRHREFNELSGGERQRVKIALALAQEPKLLLLDEPTQNLDIGRQSELLQVLQQLRETGLTVVAAIHELHLVPNNFSSVILLQPSRPPIWGSVEATLAPELLTAAFGCAPVLPSLSTFQR